MQCVHMTWKRANDPNNFFYHTDLDEIPDSVQLSKALRELSSGNCDAVRAIWRERATLDGKLTDIDLGTKINPLAGDRGFYSDGALGLYSQYPLRCNISANFMVPFTTRKIIVYRSNMRLTSGQHDVWCDKPSKTGMWSYEHQHIIHTLSFFFLLHLFYFRRSHGAMEAEVSMYETFD